jgi:hypothetical protein
MTDLEGARGDLAVFAEAIECPLAGFQSRALALGSRVTVIVAPRQSGKSRSLAVLALWWAFRSPGARVLIVSAGEEASRRLLGEVRRVAQGSELLRASVVDELAGLVTLSNASEIRSVPASERQVRGWAVDLLLVDEAALVSDDLLLGAAFPTTAARSDARVVLASSATVANGAFYDHAVAGESGSEHVATFRWRLDHCPWISPSAIAAARESMSELRFRAEFEGVFAGSADALFPRAVLERVTVDYLPDRLDSMVGPGRVFGGADWGATRDRCALVAVGRLAREDVFAVRCAVAWPSGHQLHAVVDAIAGSPAHFDALSSERNGIGEGCTQMLARAIRRRPYDAGGGFRRRVAPVLVEDDGDPLRDPPRRRRPPPLGFVTELRGVTTTAALKAATWSAIRLMVDRDRLLFPASATDLLRELLMLRVDLSPSGVERIEAGSGHDDLADALMLAAAPYSRDGRRGCHLANLDDDLQQLRLPKPPVPVAVATGEEVHAPSGVRVLRRPAWASVRGPEVTLPPGVDLTDPSLRRLRQAVGAAVNNNNDHEEADHG